jgi:hypothetical protein
MQSWPSQTCLASALLSDIGRLRSTLYPLPSTLYPPYRSLCTSTAPNTVSARTRIRIFALSQLSL